MKNCKIEQLRITADIVQSGLRLDEGSFNNFSFPLNNQWRYLLEILNGECWYLFLSNR